MKFVNQKSEIVWTPQKFKFMSVHCIFFKKNSFRISKHLVGELEKEKWLTCKYTLYWHSVSNSLLVQD